MATRSLGTLTLDLIARIGGFQEGMDKAGRLTDKRMKEMKKRAEETGKAIGTALATTATAAVGAGAAALVLLNNTAEATAETDRWAKSLGMNTSALQEWQYAATRAGLSGDNMADIFKDLNDKIDEAKGGTGEAVDALNSLGLSAKALAELSPDQQLLAIAGGLEKVKTVAEKTTILESLGNDLSRLLPLLANGAALQKEFAAQSRDFGISMTPKQIENMLKANKVMKDLEGRFQGIKNIFVSGLADVDLGKLDKSMDGIHKIVTDPKFQQGMADLASMVLDVTGAAAIGLSSLPKDVQSLVNQYKSFKAEFFGDEKDKHFAGIVNQQETIDNLKAYKQAQGELNKFATNPVMFIGDAFGKDLDADLVEAENQLKKYQAWSKQMGWKEPEVEKPEAPALELPATKVTGLGGHNGKDKTAEAAQKELNRQIKEAQSALKSLKDAYDPVGAAADDFAKQTAQVDLLLKNGKISQEEYGQATRWLADQFNEAVDSATGLSQALQYQAELERQLNNDRQQYDLQAAAVGMGDKEADRARQRLDLERETSDKVLSLRTELATASTDRQRKALQDQIDLTNEYLPKQVAAMEEGWAKIDAAQGDWSNGASRAWQNYAEQAADVAAQTESLFSDAFTGLEDGIVEFVKTGKLSFRDLADSIVEDLIRIQIRLAAVGFMSSAMGFLGGGGQGTMTGFSESLVPNAKGGVYDSPSLSAFSNGVYNTPQTFAFAKGGGVFAEAGPEAIMPLTRAADGSLGVRALGTGDTSAAEAAASGAVSVGGVTQYINVSGNADAVTVEQLRQAVEDGARGGYQIVLRDLKMNGPARQLINRR